MAVGRWYPSKIDWWLAVLLALGPAVCLVTAFVVPPSERVIAYASTGVLAAIYLGLVFPMRYGIDETHLIVRHGLVRQRIALADISEVHPSRSPLSSPALSLDRLHIKFGDGMFKSALISPAAKSEFLDELAAKAGLRREGERLVR